MSGRRGEVSCSSQYGIQYRRLCVSSAATESSDGGEKSSPWIRPVAARLGRPRLDYAARG